jgi:hypothetical protein
MRVLFRIKRLDPPQLKAGPDIVAFCAKIGPPPLRTNAQIIIAKPVAGARIAFAMKRYRIL